MKIQLSHYQSPIQFFFFDESTTDVKIYMEIQGN